jgi:hypothetical protein
MQKRPRDLPMDWGPDKKSWEQAVTNEAAILPFEASVRLLPFLRVSQRRSHAAAIVGSIVLEAIVFGSW